MSPSTTFMALARGQVFGRTVFPEEWIVERAAGNPVIDVADNPYEATEQYVPAPIILPNGDIWVYVKGTAVIYGWRSTDGGETFTLEGDLAVVAPTPATWDGSFTVEPAAVYDEDTDTIHLWYGGRDAGGDANWAWGHATAPGSDPTAFTKDPANPILTSAAVNSDLGGAGMADLKITDVAVFDGDFHFFGYALYGGVYRIIRAIGTTWNDPGDAEILLSAPGGAYTVVQGMSVFRLPNQLTPRYGMFYAIGGSQPSNPRWVRAGYSEDGLDWTFLDDDIMSPTSGWESLEVYSGAVLKQSHAPYLKPVRHGSALLYFYSGYNGSTASVGLAHLTPDA